MFRKSDCGPVSREDYPACFVELYAASEGRDFGLSFIEFAEALTRVGHSHLSPTATRTEAIEFYRKLHVRDIALAQACSRGNTSAWARFIEEYQCRIYPAALSITRNEQLARELAGSLSADLFGATDAHGRWSKFRSYSGRGSLDGWLRAILSHAYLDHCRSQHRVVSFESDPGLLNALAINNEGDHSAPDPRLAGAVRNAISSCNAQERYFLAAYFFDGQTFAGLARILGIHESTASRRLDRLLANLRTEIRRNLRKKGMSERQIKEAFHSDVRTLSFEIYNQLLGVMDSGQE